MNCLLARRLIERGVRCVQVYHTDWDHHNNIESSLDKMCPEVDRGSAAPDYGPEAARAAGSHAGGMGRRVRPDAHEPAGGNAPGRNHQIDAYSVWMAGGGSREARPSARRMRWASCRCRAAWMSTTCTRRFSTSSAWTTRKLTYRFQGRDFRLTDVAGNVIRSLVSTGVQAIPDAASRACCTASSSSSRTGSGAAAADRLRQFHKVRHVAAIQPAAPRPALPARYGPAALARSISSAAGSMGRTTALPFEPKISNDR